MTSLIRSTLAALLATLAIAAVAIGLVPAAPAAAHDYLIFSSPAEGEVLAEAPAEATLTYSGDILTIGTELALVRSDTGEFIEFPAPYTLRSGNVVQPLPPLEPGAYTLNWRVVSEDGHPIAGSLHFGIADADGNVPTVAGDAGATGGEPDETEVQPAVIIGIGALALLATAGSAVLLIVKLRRGSAPRDHDEDGDEDQDDEESQE